MNINESTQGYSLLHLSDDTSFDGQEGVISLDSQLLTFPIRGVYHYSQIPERKKTSIKAFKNVKQFIYCPAGRVLVYLENKHGKFEIELADSKTALLIEECTWIEVLCLKKDSVLSAITSEYSRPENCIETYEDFLAFIS